MRDEFYSLLADPGPESWAGGLAHPSTAPHLSARYCPPAIPFASMLATDLSLMVGLDDTRQRAESAPSLVVAAR